jgi:hypothetical protein
MIAFFVTMGVIFTAILLTAGICWVTALISDPLDDAIWCLSGRAQDAAPYEGDKG